ncbi:cytochrome P450 [Streptomyces sp. JJ36]|nr:cytochrome P450 [Streptomyces sp. JJ36]
MAAVPHAPGRLPLLGHAWPLMRDPLNFVKSLRESGDLVRVDLGGLPVVFVTNASLVHEVLVTKARFISKGRLFSRMTPLVGGGLATADGQEHRRHRRLIQPTFHHRRLAGYGEIMAARARELADAWRPGQRVDMVQEMGEFAIVTLASTMFASDLGEQAVKAVRRDIPVILQTMLTRAVLPPALDRLPVPPNRRFLAASARLRKVIDDVIKDTRASDDEHPDLLSMLLAARDADTGEALTDEEVRDELGTMLFAGTETTASTFAWTFHELARHPEVERRVLEEIDEVVGDRQVTFADMSRLTYLRQVLDEVIRLHGVTLLMRRTAQPVELGGVELPEGTEIAFSLYALHLDPRLYPEPERFDPDRWSPEQRAERPREAFVAFGAGNRKCIGDEFSWTEIMITLATVLPRWRFRPVPGVTVREETAAMARPKSVPMIVEPRAERAPGSAESPGLRAS